MPSVSVARSSETKLFETSTGAENAFDGSMGSPTSIVTRGKKAATAAAKPTSPDTEAAMAETNFQCRAHHDGFVGGVGRLCDQKAFHRILDIAPAILRQLPDTRFIFIGDGPLRGALENQAEKLGIQANVHWLGFRSDVAALLDAIDVLVMPSEFEGLPLALLEALARGCPAVAHAVDGIPEVIDDEINGFLVPHGDANLLASRIVQLLNDSSLAGRISEQAYVKAKRAFTTEKMVDETVAVYEAVLGLRRANATRHSI